MIILLFLTSFGCAHSQKREELAELHLRTGAALLQQGKYPEALAELLTAQDYNPRNPTVHNYLGLAYYVRDKFILSEEHFRRAISIKADYSEAKNNLSRVLIEQGKYNEAIALANTVLQDLTYVNPEKAHINKGLALFRAKRFVEARDSFQSALSINRNSCLAQNYYGRSLYELEKFELASRVLDSAVGLCRQQMFDEPHYYSALSFYKMGDSSRARARLAEVLEFYPEGKYRDNATEMLNLIR